MIKVGDTVRILELLVPGTDLNQKSPVGLTGTVVGGNIVTESMIHVRLHLPESSDPRVYPDLFFEDELEVVGHGKKRSKA